MAENKEFRVNEDGSVPQELLPIFYNAAWEPDFLTVQQFRDSLEKNGKQLSGGGSGSKSAMMGQLVSMLRKLKPGSEVQRFQSPMFTQRPKSALELAADSYSPRPELLQAYAESDPVKRLLAVFQRLVQCLVLAQTRGLEHGSPYNPVLRERFVCRWEHKDSTTHFVAEQVSHHPAIMANIMWNEKARFYAWETRATTPVFRGNSLDFPVKGENRVVIYVQKGEKEFTKEEYQVHSPGLCLSGLILGSTRMGVASQEFEIVCKATGLTLKGKFKSGKEFNGSVYRAGNLIRSLRASLDGKCLMIDLEQHPKSKNWSSHGEVFMDNTNLVEKIPLKQMDPIEKMHPLESRRVWFSPNYAIRGLHDLTVAGKYKSMIEEHQRHLREQPDFNTDPLLFRPTGNTVDNVPIHHYHDMDRIDKICSGAVEAEAGADEELD